MLLLIGSKFILANSLKKKWILVVHVPYFNTKEAQRLGPLWVRRKDPKRCGVG